MQFVEAERRYFCGTCSHWSDPVQTQAQAPDPRNPTCTCGGPTRLDMVRGMFFCDACQRHLGEGAAEAITKHKEKQKNKLGLGAWIGILIFVLGAGGVVTWQILKEKKAEPDRIGGKPVRVVPKGETQLKVGIGTVNQQNNQNYRVMNKGFKNVIASKDTKKGHVIIRFGYDHGQGGTQQWMVHNGNVAVPMNILIRVFDKNGKYLTHVVTKERFVPQGFMNEGLRRKRAVPLLPKGNTLRYAVNQRDLDYTKSVEVGVTWVR